MRSLAAPWAGSSPTRLATTSSPRAPTAPRGSCGRSSTGTSWRVPAGPGSRSPTATCPACAPGSPVSTARAPLRSASGSAHTDPVSRAARSVLLALCVVALVVRQAPPLAANSFGAEIARLSEPEGAFDTDNLISNERSYLEVIPTLVAGGVSGGAYIGVGPDQNFSYIARIRPSVAYILDVRRDNLLLHLLFKALFARAPTRVAYLCLLTGRAPPGPSTVWTSAPVERIVRYAADAPPLT